MLVSPDLSLDPFLIVEINKLSFESLELPLVYVSNSTAKELFMFPET